jgi:hypothetical protein
MGRAQRNPSRLFERLTVDPLRARSCDFDRRDRSARMAMMGFAALDASCET